MSATEIKATRREIRRAFGPRAIEALAFHESNLEAITEALKNHAGVIRDHDQGLKVVTAHVQLGFWGRLRWILCGLRADG